MGTHDRRNLRLFFSQFQHHMPYCPSLDACRARKS